MVKCELWKNDSALFNLASSSKTPYTVEPLPDRLANFAPLSNNFCLIAPISGYAGITIFSKSFSKNLNVRKFFLIKSANLGIMFSDFNLFLICAYAHFVLIDISGMTNNNFSFRFILTGVSLNPVSSPICDPPFIKKGTSTPILDPIFSSSLTSNPIL